MYSGRKLSLALKITILARRSALQDVGQPLRMSDIAEAIEPSVQLPHFSSLTHFERDT